MKKKCQVDPPPSRRWMEWDNLSTNHEEDRLHSSQAADTLEVSTQLYSAHVGVERPHLP